MGLFSRSHPSCRQPATGPKQSWFVEKALERVQQHLGEIYGPGPGSAMPAPFAPFAPPAHVLGQSSTPAPLALAQAVTLLNDNAEAARALSLLHESLLSPPAPHHHAHPHFMESVTRGMELLARNFHEIGSPSQQNAASLMQDHCVLLSPEQQRRVLQAVPVNQKNPHLMRVADTLRKSLGDGCPKSGRAHPQSMLRWLDAAPPEEIYSRVFASDDPRMRPLQKMVMNRSDTYQSFLGIRQPQNFTSPAIMGMPYAPFALAQVFTTAAQHWALGVANGLMRDYASKAPRNNDDGYKQFDDNLGKGLRHLGNNFHQIPPSYQPTAMELARDSYGLLSPAQQSGVADAFGRNPYLYPSGFPSSYPNPPPFASPFETPYPYQYPYQYPSPYASPYPFLAPSAPPNLHSADSRSGVAGNSHLPGNPVNRDTSTEAAGNPRDMRGPAGG